MTDLRVMAVSSDGARLVLKAADGQEFTLPIDDRLRAAVRGDRARLGQIEIELDSQLRPRDIQARIRAGATAEEVAEFAGLPVERVRRFEGPVLAERAFMAERAQNTQIRRQGESHGPKLGEVVAERLSRRGADHDTTQWDSWRRDDGTWLVRLLFRISGEGYEATWSFDPPRRLVSATDDEARLLSDEEGGAPAEATFPFVPRIARLPQHAAPETSAASATSDLRTARDNGRGEPSRLDTVASLRSQPDRPDWGDRAARTTVDAPAAAADIPPIAAVPASAEEDAEEVSTRPAARATVGAGAAFDALFPRVAAPHMDRKIGTTDRQAEADGVRPGRRATVPSWDEIVFGSRRSKPE